MADPELFKRFDDSTVALRAVCLRRRKEPNTQFPNTLRRRGFAVTFMLLARQRILWPLAGLCLVSLTLAGCDSKPKRVKVAGIVTIDGQPVPSGSVRIIPAGDRPANGEIGKDGRFVLGSFEADDGCVPGTHKVEVIATETVPTGVKWNAPEKYSSASTSGLTVTIDEPTDNLEIKLTWDGGKPFVKEMPKE